MSTMSRENSPSSSSGTEITWAPSPDRDVSAVASAPGPVPSSSPPRPPASARHRGGPLWTMTNIWSAPTAVGNVITGPPPPPASTPRDQWDARPPTAGDAAVWESVQMVELPPDACSAECLFFDTQGVQLILHVDDMEIAGPTKLITEGVCEAIGRLFDASLSAVLAITSE
ncbi:hypothetical protein CNMCM5793_003929 [Aspergillus hiratsukae]|uniref:Uncharacterized protein n=1 Tax=Aspergillus hiratsukae TaxID=1194566 RepID=A0A8H6PEH4_9EURO|nr:hypothetical protein CNMCM5793_003929 [Aspergillus hiratsukae]KAF7169230.1 hypothetical protein CNMCM6106_004179 [Aspergillus hiratsukae]